MGIDLKPGRLDVMGSDGGIVEFVITGKARGMVVDDLKAEMLVPILKENIDREVRTITGEAG